MKRDTTLPFVDQVIIARLYDDYALRVPTGIGRTTIPFHIKGARVTTVVGATTAQDLGFSNSIYLKQFDNLRHRLRRLNVDFTVASVVLDSPTFTLLAGDADSPFLIWNRYDPPGRNKSGAMNRVFIRGRIYRVDEAIHQLEKMS